MICSHPRTIQENIHRKITIPTIDCVTMLCYIWFIEQNNVTLWERGDRGEFDFQEGSTGNHRYILWSAISMEEGTTNT